MTKQYVDTQRVLGQKSIKQLQAKLKNAIERRQKAPLASKYTANNLKGVSNQDYGQLINIARQAQADKVDEQPSAYVRVPSVNLALPIYQGTNLHTLSLGATTYFSHQQMGQGNYVLAGHNMNIPGVLFSNVPQIKVGAKIELVNQTMVYDYRVTKTKQVNPEQPYVGKQPATNSVLYQQPAQPTVTLFTCNATGSMREVVQGTLVRSQLN
ncbi:class A sortase [Lactiplantibacillus plantarum]|nr:class A sortase [Lactiplantibacillus plantarum]